MFIFSYFRIGMNTGSRNIKQRIKDFENDNLALISELQNKDAIIRQLYKNSSLIFVKLGKNLEITDVNGNWIKFLGYSKKTSLGKKFSSFIVHSSKKDFLLWLQQLKEGQSVSCEIKLVNREKKSFLVSLIGSINYFPNKKIESIVVLIDNEIYHKETEQELEYERRLLQNLMDNIPDAIYFKDKKSRFTRINKAQAKMLGIRKPQDAIYKTDFDFFSYQHAKETFRDEQNIIKTGKPIINKEEKIVSKDNRIIWGATSKVGIRNEKKEINQIVGITRDITLKKKSEDQLKQALDKAREADMLKSAFLANMSHEIRTPLNGIIGFAELLKKKNIPFEKQQLFIDIISKSGKTLLNLINDIIDLSKIEAGQLKISHENFEINSLLNEIYLIFNEQLKSEERNEIKFLLKTPENSDNLVISSDPGRVRQIFNNLISNALKFTLKGKIEIGYEIDLINKLAVFFVSDTGIGIEKEKLNEIFERFSQIRSSGLRNEKGTGLGLAITKGLVQLLGGEISVESKLGKGSTFKFSLPLIKDYSKAVSGERSGSKKTGYKWKEKKMLIVEDDYYSYELLHQVLSPTDISVTYAEDGNKAIEKIQKDADYDLILMDIKMPGMDGFETLKKIKKIKKNIPVIAQTAYAMDGEEKKTIEAGFDNYIAKPIDTGKLLNLINKYIDQQEG